MEQQQNHLKGQCNNRISEHYYIIFSFHTAQVLHHLSRRYEKSGEASSLESFCSLLRNIAEN